MGVEKVKGGVGVWSFFIKVFVLFFATKINMLFLCLS